jgi:hypothetical protein
MALKKGISPVLEYLLYCPFKIQRKTEIYMKRGKNIQMYREGIAGGICPIVKGSFKRYIIIELSYSR